MKMTSLKMKRLLEERLSDSNLNIQYNRDNDTLRVELKSTKQGVNIKLPSVIVKYNTNGEQAIDELVSHISESLRIMGETQKLTGKEKYIFPVIRSTSFPTKANSGTELVYKEHTAETRIFYALDLGKSYRLVDQKMLEEANFSQSQIEEIATFNLRSLENDYKVDTVADNDFYFFAKQDGYDASRILNDSILDDLKKKSKGDIAVAVPHQDVLIVADIQNKTGYDILAQMTMKFFTEGRIPITSLPFIYEDDKLTPIFILAKNKPEK
ncbi:DUF1444 domain-containing protein [Ornithinibacillus halotolerans]|uniref:UPF0354 protein GCM10008025_27110 n=1 Tax=Ornithinibacillus halotolerans TaxID=1274357 RepID=A0A916S5I1_9BACI|nr:DUF1444 domain-containing protein [Ornithinibacillus halotolerans]GGA82464.1 UPF0354 protein YtpQ [Ornithinibacillus halotolerans]